VTDASSSSRRTLSGRVLSWAAPKRRRRRALGRVLRTAAPVLPRKPAPSRPIFVLGAPRSGTTVLFDVLNQAPGVASLDRETGVVWDTFHRVEDADWASHEVGPEDVTPAERRYLYWAIDRLALGKRYLDKLPRNTLRVLYLQSLFPDAAFVFLRRDGRAVVSSLMTGWRSGPRFGRGMVPPIPLSIEGYEGNTWKFLLPPGWETYAQGHRLAEVCAFQWLSANESVLAAKEHVAPDRWVEVSYEEMTERPRATAERTLDALGLSPAPEAVRYAEELDRHVTKKAVTPPKRDKWREENGPEIEKVLPQIGPMMRRLGYPVD
jgi:Sulfotransferase family